MLVDSNIIIYAVQPENTFLTDFIETNPVAVASITRIEVLGFHLWHTLDADRQSLLEHLMETVTVLPLDDPVVDRAIRLRRRCKMSLGDSIVAATALLYELQLVTRNADDFKGIAELRLLNPFRTHAD
jgi:predicted nucleic acid-binding protein